MTQSAYPGLSKAEDLFHDLVWQVVLNAGLDYLFIQVPILGIFPLKNIISSVVNFISDKFYAAIRMAVDLSAINLVNAMHQKAFDNASVTLKIIAQDKGIESDEYKNAKENAKNALAKFIHYGAAVA